MSKRKWKMPRKMSLVKFDFSDLEERYVVQYKKTFDEECYVFMGEIVNMRGHCVVVSHRTGKVISGYHTDNFIELTEDET